MLPLILSGRVAVCVKLKITHGAANAKKIQKSYSVCLGHKLSLAQKPQSNDSVCCFGVSTTKCKRAVRSDVRFFFFHPVVFSSQIITGPVPS